MAKEKYIQNVEYDSEVSYSFTPLVHVFIASQLTPMQVANAEAIDPALEAREKALVWKQDLRIVPLCAAIYLLCYLDRSNIGMSKLPTSKANLKLRLSGNAKILNSDTGNDLLTETNMTSYQFT
jgi:hypothetical protein